MKESTTDELKGKAHEVKDAVKEMAGQVTNNPELEAEGHVERVSRPLFSPGAAPACHLIGSARR
jgi:hypothetical protein